MLGALTLPWVRKLSSISVMPIAAPDWMLIRRILFAADDQCFFAFVSSPDEFCGAAELSSTDDATGEMAGRSLICCLLHTVSRPGAVPAAAGFPLHNAATARAAGRFPCGCITRLPACESSFGR